MWKEFLEKLVESCAYMDPLAYMYYAAAKREPLRPVPAGQDEADDRELVRLLERLQSKNQASA
jgi:hypothetical protein